MYLVFVLGFGQSHLVFGQIQNQTVFKDGINNIPRTIDKIQCDEVEHLVFHNHTKLVIKIQNETQQIPGGIGIIPNNCIFWLHTHDESGIIHVESPIKQSFTLEQFLNIWKEFDTSSYDGDLPGVSPNNNLTITVDDAEINATSADFNKVILKDNSIISVNVVGNTSKN
jgi:hypothetical protein